MKMSKSAFLGQNSGGDMGGQAHFSGSGGDPTQSPPLGETLPVAYLFFLNKKDFYRKMSLENPKPLRK